MSFSELVAVGFWGLLLSVVWALLVWGCLGAVLLYVMVKSVRRLGWLDTVAPGRRWPRVVLKVVLVLGVWPPVVLAGVVGAIRDNTIDALESHVAEDDHVERLGAMLVMPMVAAREVAGGTDPAELVDMDLQRGDVSFLLDADERRKASKLLTRSLLDLARWDFDHRSWSSRWLRDYAETKMIGYIEDHRATYDALFAHLKADPDGGLSFTSAGKQVAGAFLAQQVYPQVSAVLDGVRLNLLLTSALIWFAILGSLWWMAWRVASRTSRMPVEDRVAP